MYQMMESAWRPPAPDGTRPAWMEPFAQTINAAKKYVVSTTLQEVDWNAELVRGDLGQAIQQLKEEPGEGLLVGGVQLPLALTELGLIDRVRAGGASPTRGPRADTVRRALEVRRLETCEPVGIQIGGGGDAVRTETLALGPPGPSTAGVGSAQLGPRTDSDRDT